VLLYRMSDYKAYISEFFGTCFLVFVILSVKHPLAIGLALIIAVYLTNAHLNPVVSLVFVVSKELEIQELLPYVISQGAGALLAYELSQFK
jgi:glycerol uptake facilitator-like aquaporin